MNKHDTNNKLLLELNFKFQMQDYRLRFLTKRGWIIGLILILLRLMLWHFKDGP